MIMDNEWRACFLSWLPLLSAQMQLRTLGLSCRK